MTDKTPRKTLAEWLAAEPGEPIQVTILFTDIVGSTKLNKSIGDKKWLERLLQHFKQGLELVADYDGYKIKFIGDSFMVAFRNPVNALGFATEFSKNTGHDSIHIRACIHTGIGRVIEDDIFGSMINYAARVISWKRDAGVVLSATTYEALTCEYGEQRAKEIVVQFNDEELKDFRKQSLYVLNFEEWWVTRIREAVPDLEELPKADCAAGCLLRAATPEDVDWIAELEVRTFGRDGVPSHILHAWYDANPNGFSVVSRENGEMIGHIDILPIKPVGVDLLLRGRESEQAIRPEMVYSTDEQHLMEAFYVESIIIKDKYKELKPSALFSILSSFETLIARICDSEGNKRLYGLGGTVGGERLMQQLGFRLVGLADERSDHYPLYVANYGDIQINIAAILDGARQAGDA